MLWRTLYAVSRYGLGFELWTLDLDIGLWMVYPGGWYTGTSNEVMSTP
jgi:hypothetical protein